MGAEEQPEASPWQLFLQRTIYSASLAASQGAREVAEKAEHFRRSELACTHNWHDWHGMPSYKLSQVCSPELYVLASNMCILLTLVIFLQACCGVCSSIYHIRSSEEKAQATSKGK